MCFRWRVNVSARSRWRKGEPKLIKKRYANGRQQHGSYWHGTSENVFEQNAGSMSCHVPSPFFSSRFSFLISHLPHLTTCNLSVSRSQASGVGLSLWHKLPYSNNTGQHCTHWAHCPTHTQHALIFCPRAQRLRPVPTVLERVCGRLEPVGYLTRRSHR